MPDLTQYNNILLYGGSFDPPHLAHIQLPPIAAKAIQADALAYIPTANQPLKLNQAQTPAHHRLAMLKLALSQIPNATILTDEIDRANRTTKPAPSYTVDTLEHLHSKLSHTNNNTPKLNLLLGADSLRDFWHWRNPPRILELATPVVMLRPPHTIDQLLTTIPKSQNPELWRPRFVQVPLLDISSTNIRQRIAQNQDVSDYITKPVQDYIKQHSLYQQAKHPA